MIRSISGVLGVLGVAAIAFDAVLRGSIDYGFILAAKLFAGYVFLFVALFGKYPWDRRDAD